MVAHQVLRVLHRPWMAKGDRRREPAAPGASGTHQRASEKAPGKLDVAGPMSAWLLGWLVFGRIADRFGAPAAVLTLILVAVKLFAGTETQDDFIRAVLFGEFGWPLPVLGVFLVADLLFGFRLRRKWVDGESDEIRRLADERSGLQEQLLGVRLSHTEHPDHGHEPEDEPEAREMDPEISAARRRAKIK